MYRKKKQIGQLIVCFIDLAAVLLCLLAAGLLRYRTFATLFRKENIMALFGVVGILHIALYYIFNIYGTIYRRTRYQEIFLCIGYNLALTAAAILIGFAMKTEVFTSRLVFGYFFIFDSLVMCALHIVIRNRARIFHLNNSKFLVNLMIFADGQDIPEIVHRFRFTKETHWNIVGIVPLNHRELIKESDYPDIPILSVRGKDDYLDFATRHVVDEVFVQVQDNRSSSRFLKRLILEFEQMGVVVNLSLNVFNLNMNGSKQINTVEEYPVMTFTSQLFDYRMIVLKRIMDILGSVVGLILAFVIGILIAPALLIESPGPLIFRQKRVGVNGRIFNFYKFRSMYKDAEERKEELMSENEMNGPMFKIENDPRITKVGAFIRRTSIDELPQFFNVLKGDMSLVGTRPPTVDEYMQYTAEQKRRISFKPGITGLWQVSGRSNIRDFEEVVKLDLEYIDNWSIGLDVRIILKTIGIVIKRAGAK